MEYADSLCKVKREKGLMTAVQANKIKMTRKEMTGTVCQSSFQLIRFFQRVKLLQQVGELLIKGNLH